MFYEISLYSTQNHFRLFLSQFMKRCHDHLPHLLLLIIGGINKGQTEFYKEQNNTRGKFIAVNSYM